MEKIHIREGSYIAKRAAKNLGSKDVAIVIWNTIFIFGVDTATFLQDKKWLRHEIEHTKQWRSNGFLLFLVKYLWYSWKYSYYDNPFEVAARNAENDLDALSEYDIEYDTLYKKETGRMGNLPRLSATYRVLTFLIGAMLLYLIMAKSWHIPITHDESMQIMNICPMSIYDIFMYTSPWPTNHILNTLLIKLFTAILGHHLWVERLPNNLAFILYYVYVLKWARKFYNKDFLGVLTTVTVLCLIPYVFDFFSVARGYGLALSFQLVAMYHVYNYVYAEDTRELTRGQTAMLLMILSNFSWLLLWAVMQGVLFVFSAWRQKPRQFLIIFGSFLMGLGFSIVPVIRMTSTDQFKYWNSNGFYENTFEPLVRWYLYDFKFVTLNANGVFFFFLGICIILLVYVYLFKSKKVLWLFPVLYFGLMLAEILQNKLIGTPYLTGRTALMYYPLMGLILLAYLRVLLDNKVSYRLTAVAFTIFGTLLFVTNYAEDYVLEWKYDQYTYEILDLLESRRAQNQDTVYVGTHWLFTPSLKYTIQTGEYNWIKLTDFSYHPIVPNTQNYYYTIETERSDPDALGFKNLKYFNPNQVLLYRQ